MNIEIVKGWLRQSLRTAMAWNLVTMAASLLAGLLVLYISFWASYAVIWFISHSFFRLSHPVILLIAGAFMTLVVIVGAKQNLEPLDPLNRQTGLARDMDITLSPWNRYGMSYTTNAAKAAAFEVRSVASVVNYILCGGVILVLGSVQRLRRWRRMKAIDVDGCARVIALLHATAKRRCFEEIVGDLPGLNPVQVFDDLRFVEGVLFLADDPPGLRLHPETKSELDHLRTGPA